MREALPVTARRMTASLGLLIALGLLTTAIPGATAASAATFSGFASLHVVGKTDSGALVAMSMSGVPYHVAITSSSMTLVAMGMTMGGPVASGAISISASRASGGGVLGGSTPSQMGFVATTTGGQFQCLMAGFSAGFSLTMDGMTLTIIQMDVHGAVAPGSYLAS